MNFIKKFFSKLLHFKSQSRSLTINYLTADQHKLNIYNDMIAFQDTLLDVMKIPIDFEQMKPYQKAIYDVIENRKDRIFRKMI